MAVSYFGDNEAGIAGCQAKHAMKLPQRWWPMRCAVPRLGKGVVIWAVRSILGGGQYGHHNPFYHHRRHIVTSRRRLVWPRTVVLGSDSPCISPHVAARAR